MKLFRFHFNLFVAALAISLGHSGLSQAGLMPVGATATQAGNDFSYSYGVSLPAGSIIHTGDYFTIYDFQGLVAGTNTQPTGYTFSSANVGPTPAGATPTDNPTIANVTWTYNGPTAMVGPANLGNFVVQSQFDMTTQGKFVAVSLLLSEHGGTVDVNQANVTVPSSTCGVPEPAALALAAIGLPLIGAYRRFRSKR